MPITHVEAHNKKLLDEIEACLNKAKRIVFITGAGISTSCGIPDFRSKEGLYSLINSEHSNRTGSTRPFAGNCKGKDLFSSTVWNDEDSTSVFYAFIASLRSKINQDVKSSSQTHKFLRRVRDQKKLLRCYTQNIDGLETRDGLCSDMKRGKGTRGRFTKSAINLPDRQIHNLPGGKLDGGVEVVQLHGDLETVRCTICQRTKDWTSLESTEFLKGRPPICQDCETEDIVRQAAGKRSSAVGTLRPNIVLYGENNPMETEIGNLVSHDLKFSPDLLIIMGTSLKVHGLKTVVKEFAKAVHSKKGKVIFINNSEPAKSTWKDVIDYWVDMDCDEWSKNKLRIKQIELPFDKQTKSTKRDLQDKENLPATPSKKNKSGMLPTPPSTGKKRVLMNLDPICLSHAHNSRRVPNDSGISLANLSDIESPLTPRSNKRRRSDSEFKIWESAEDVIALAASAMPLSIPRSKKRNVAQG